LTVRRKMAGMEEPIVCKFWDGKALYFIYQKKIITQSILRMTMLRAEH